MRRYSGGPWRSPLGMVGASVMVDGRKNVGTAPACLNEQNEKCGDQVTRRAPLHTDAQRRPSPIHVLTFAAASLDFPWLSSEIFARNSNNPATAARTDSEFRGPSGTSRATGFSWRVMITSSPWATRSKS